MARQSFFVRMARGLMRRPQARVSRARLEAMTLEAREMPAVSGTVFQDFNASGTFDTSGQLTNLGGTTMGTPVQIGTIPTAIDVGIPNVTVTIFNAAGAKVDQVTSKADGTWQSNLTVAGQQYRVEFTGVPLNGFQYGPHGASAGTATQFVMDGATNVNLSLVRDAEYYRQNPLVVTSQYYFGSASGQAANFPGILSFPYASGSVQQMDNTISNIQQPDQHAIAIPTSQVGTTWGLGYNRDAKAGYAAAFTKRHSGMGPGGPGAIYTFALPSADTPGAVTTATQWVNLQGATALDLATNTTFTVDTLGGFGAYLAARNAPGYDYDRDGDDTGWNAVGKSSLGGLDVSDDGQFVYVMNLADNRLYIIPVLANGAADTANIRAIQVPTPAGVAAGDLRAWAVEYHNGQVYVGLVDSAESDQAQATLRGFVYAFNPTTNTFGASLVNDASGLGFDLSYDRGASFGGNDTYRPWSPTYNRLMLNQVATVGLSSQYPQPMLTGLAFDRQGNLSISIRDRNGDQTGRGTLANGAEAGPVLLAGSAAGRVEGVASGELLKAFVDGAAFRIEANGANPNNVAQSGTGVGGGVGPAGGEFYGEDDYAGNGHRGTSLGGITQIPGFGSILNTHFDPLINGQLRTGGVRWFNAATGTLEKAYQIYETDALAGTPQDPNGTFGKANGLGDLVAIESLDPPIEIGNRLFRDTDRDGVQDPGEPVLVGVTVQLQTLAGVTLATAVTGDDGSYYFNNGPGTNSKNEIYNVAGLVNGQKYQVVIPNVAGAQQAALTGLVLTGANATHTGDGATNDGNGDLRNSDFTLVGTSAVSIVDLSSNLAGNSDHTADAGFVDGVSLGNFVWEDANNDGLFNGAEAGIDGITVNLYKAAAPTTLVATQSTAGGGAYLFTGLLPDDYIVEIVGPAGFRSSSGGGADLVNGPFETGLAGNSANNNEDHGKAISGSNLTGYIIRSNPVTLTAAGNPDSAGAANLRQDFGLVRTFSLGNRVWLDKNNSGTIDAADGATPGIDGATVKLYRPADFDAAGQLVAGKTAFRTTSTANGGYYRFDDLLGAASAGDLSAGSYVVVVDATGVLAGAVSSSGTNGSASGPFEPAPNAIAAPTTTDSDDSGTTIGGNLVRSGVTVVGPAATLPINEPDLVGIANPQGTIDAAANMTVDFGFYRPLALGNFIWDDKNNNGAFDAGEAPLDGVSVQLIDGAGKNVGGSITTAGGGLYQFNNLIPGTYTVRVTTPTGFTSSTGLVGSKAGPFEPAPQTTTNNVDHGTINSKMTAGMFVEATVALGDPGNSGNPDTIVNANDANLRQDFGFFRPLAIGDFIFEDVDNNGVFDGADVPVSNVLVELLDGTNTVIGSATTVADGKYRFDNLIAGNYTVRITPPTGLGYASSTGANGKATGPYEPATGITNNNEDHGTTSGNVIVTTLTLQPAGGNPDEGGTANLAQDFGLYRPVLLGNLVWADLNNNGVFDPLGGEAGIPGVAVDLLDAGGTVIASTTTDENGLYQFPVAPGQYRVRITPPAGLASSTGNGPGNSTSGPYEPSTGKTADSEDKGTTAATFIQTELITIATPGTADNPDNGGFANLRQDFGLFSPISLALGNFVFEDANNNGTFDTGETPIGGATVTLFDALGNTVGTATTPADGSYRFENLPPGSYTVQVVAPAGYRNSDGVGVANNTDHGVIDPTQPNKATSSVTLTDPSIAPNPDEAGKANLLQDFGFWRPQAIGNFVFVDVNNNGTKDAAEAGLAGVAVSLLKGATVVGSTTTDAKGNYLFTNLLPGTYTVRVAPPAGFATSTGKNGSASGPFEPGLSDNTNDADHGTAVGANIESTVTLISPVVGGNPDGLDNLRQDFGLFQPLSFGNTVFIDSNKNGNLDTGEQMVAGAVVRLVDSGGTTVGQTTTGTDGKYLFTNLAPGTYTAILTPPAGFTLTPVTVDPTVNTGNQNVGQMVGNEIQATVTLAVGGAPLIEGNTNGNMYLNGDFGLVAPPTAKVSGFVYRDPNLDGQYVRGTSPTGDTPIGGVTIQIFNNANTLVGTTKTDGNGFYQFINLPPGTYTIRETQPAGLLDAFDTPGTLGGSSPSNDVLQVTLMADDDGQFYNFGEYAPTMVSGYVWVDDILNCVYDYGREPVVAGVPVTISGTAFAGTPLERPLTAADVPGGLTVLTNVAGHYSFPVLPPGVYTVSRGDIPAGPTTFLDWCEQNNDPTNPLPTITNNRFSSVSTIPGVIRGDLNFGLVRPSTIDPSKQNFLGSSGNQPIVPGTIPPPGGPTRGDVQLAPLFNVNNAAANSAYTVVASGLGISPQVRVFDYATGGEKFRLTPYESSFVGGIRVAQGDVNGDGIDDIVTTTGIGGGPRTVVFDGATGQVIRNFFAFEDTFRGGTWVAVGDVDGDGFGDVIVGAEVGGGPRITTFSGKDGSILNNFFAFDANQRGGTRVAAGDFNGDGKADIVATTGFGVPTRVRVFDGTNVGNVLRDFAPYEANFFGGVNIAVGDFNGDNTPDIAVGAEITGGPRAQIFSGKDNSVLANFFAFESTFSGGVRVAATDANGDGRDELVVTPGPGGAARVRVIDVATLGDLDAYFAFMPEFVGGAYVG